jgi:hypothetical protein
MPRQRRNPLITRRHICIGAPASLICGPAIVRITSLMPVRPLPLPFGRQYAGFVERLYFQALDRNLRAGQMSVVHNGKIISVAAARRIVARARAYGWLT